LKQCDPKNDPLNSIDLIALSTQVLLPTYARFPLAFARGKGARLWDFEGKEYLDFGGGIAVTSLGHAHPKIIEAITQQAQTLTHTSNLYHTEPAVRLAQTLVKWTGPGKCFFCNSGAEANEALYKLARKKGHDSKRFEIITTLQSFHGRTLAGIAATGQEKVKKGFEPAVEGFRHVPFNDLAATEKAITDKTVAILIEGIQGEIGIIPASPDYLLGLRKLCNERNLLLMMDAIQCGMFRTGRFLSYERILENSPSKDFLPDAISMAKGMANGFPIGSIWVREPYTELLGAGSHGTTFGGTPLACSASLAAFETIRSEKLAENARIQGEYLKKQILEIHSPHVREVRGFGLMLGVELQAHIPALRVEGKNPAALFTSKLHELGLLTIPSANPVIRLLPPLNVTRAECDEAVDKLSRGLSQLS